MRKKKPQCEKLKLSSITVN